MRPGPFSRMPRNAEELDALMRAIYGDAKWERHLAALERRRARLRGDRSATETKP